MRAKSRNAKMPMGLIAYFTASHRRGKITYGYERGRL